MSSGVFPSASATRIASLSPRSSRKSRRSEMTCVASGTSATEIHSPSAARTALLTGYVCASFNDFSLNRRRDHQVTVDFSGEARTFIPHPTQGTEYHRRKIAAACRQSSLMSSGFSFLPTFALGLYQQRHECFELIPFGLRQVGFLILPTNTLPIIQSLLKSSNEKDREKGVIALAATEQPTVLPILVRALSDSSLRVRSAVAQGLVSLTRETPSKDGLFWSGTDPATDAPFWSAWLRANPQLPIHPIDECHEVGRW